MNTLNMGIEIQRLEALRRKLVSRRRSIVANLVGSPAANMTGTTIGRIQGAIDAIDRAIADERKIDLDIVGHSSGNGVERLQTQVNERNRYWPGPQEQSRPS